jgi:RNA polymerase sigma-70 factor (sigma-E family)
MVRLAELLTRDRGHAEDLAQHAFTAAFAAWPRIGRGDPEAYVRRCIVNKHRDRWRRGMWRERPTDRVDDRLVAGDHAGVVTMRTMVLGALARLSDRERTVIVLRFYCDLTEAAIAGEMRVPVGTVKSTTSRALAKLRADAELVREVTS